VSITSHLIPLTKGLVWVVFSQVSGQFKDFLLTKSLPSVICKLKECGLVHPSCFFEINMPLGLCQFLLFGEDAKILRFTSF